MSAQSMSLEYTDFDQFYRDSGMSEAEAREDFEVYVVFMECLVAHFWSREPQANSLGISLDNATLAHLGTVNLPAGLPATFDEAARDSAAGKSTP